ncbi:MAG TPA: hypothetical protein VEW94_08675 [Chloroflexia bacterium]|nr:hypothetical protein [Chloroflexia bacterium]
MQSTYSNPFVPSQAHAGSASCTIGPYDPMLPAPMRLRLELRPAGDSSPLGWGAQISSVEVERGYNYVGLEERVRSGGVDWQSALRLVEGICGCCSQANLLAFVQAAEAMANLIVPPRAAYLRLVLAETERIVSHLLNAADMMRALGLHEKGALLLDLRERIVHALAEWSGVRSHPGLIVYGGVASNPEESDVRALTLTARGVERALRAQVTTTINSREAAGRLVGLGGITAQEAVVAGLRGPVLRGSGVAIDIRATFPTGAYEDEAVTIVVQRAGDAFSRLIVRLLECLESLRVIEQAMDDLPTGPFRGRGDMELRTGSAVGRAEGPRGEVFCWARGGEDGLRGLHLSAGSFPSLGIVPGLLKGQRLEDLPLLLLSLDLCVPSTER